MSADVATAEPVRAITAHALRGHRAWSAVQTFANASTVAPITAGARRGCNGILLRIRDVDAVSKVARAIACLARLHARGIAANAVDAEAARALCAISTRRTIGQIVSASAASAHSRAIAFPVGAFVLRIGGVENEAALAVVPARQRTRATLAETTTDEIATIIVDAIAAQAFARHRARDAVQCLARAFAVTSIGVGARGTARGIRGIVGDERAYADRTRDVARFARVVACQIAANAVGAEAARAIRRRTARLTIVTLAHAHAVARIRCGA